MGGQKSPYLVEEGLQLRSYISHACICVLSFPESKHTDLDPGLDRFFCDENFAQNSALRVCNAGELDASEVDFNMFEQLRRSTHSTLARCSHVGRLALDSDMLLPKIRKLPPCSHRKMTLLFLMDPVVEVNSHVILHRPPPLPSISIHNSMPRSTHVRMQPKAQHRKVVIRNIVTD